MKRKITKAGKIVLEVPISDVIELINQKYNLEFGPEVYLRIEQMDVTRSTITIWGHERELGSQFNTPFLG